MATAVLAAACGGGSSNGSDALPNAQESTPPASTADATATPPLPGPAAVPSVGCFGTRLVGDLDWTVRSGDRDRILHVHVPAVYSVDKPMPVVLGFHGYMSNATQQDALSGMSRKADEVGFIAVHAEGIGVEQSWNAGACCGVAMLSGVDDVAFVNTMLDQIESRLCVDTRRIFATGMSNGGFLSHRLACELSSRIAAVSPVAGVLGITECHPSRPMSILQFHGTLDPLVPYDGRPSLQFPAVEPTIADWAKRSGCAGAPRETLRHGEAHCSTYDGCAGGAEVTLCTVDGGGHTWPGGMPVPSLGHTTRDIDATKAMWEFFLRHPLP